MNPRIGRDELSGSPYRDLIQGLATQWVDAQLTQPAWMAVDYRTDLETLLLTTQSVGRTETIFRAVLAQAVALSRSSVWVEKELKFEAML